MFAELFRSPHNTFTIKPAIFSELFRTAMVDESIRNSDKLYICFYIMLRNLKGTDLFYMLPPHKII